METILFWKGKPVEEMPKEELVEALKWCAKEMERLYKQNEHDRNFLIDCFAPRKNGT